MYGSDLSPSAAQRADLISRRVGVSNGQAVYYRRGTPGTRAAILAACSQANMLAPFIKHLKMTGLTDGSMYDHRCYHVSVVEAAARGRPKYLRGKSADKACWRSGCTDKRKWLTLYLNDPREDQGGCAEG